MKARATQPRDFRYRVQCTECNMIGRRSTIPPSSCRRCGAAVVELDPVLPGPTPRFNHRKVVYAAVEPATEKKLRALVREGNFRSFSAAVASVLDAWASQERERDPLFVEDLFALGDFGDS